MPIAFKQKFFIYLFILTLILISQGCSNSVNEKDKPFNTSNKIERNLVIVTIDGLRWQEVFNGADIKLIEHPPATQDSKKTKARFWHTDTQTRKEILMPFVTNIIAEQGAIIGDRNKGSYMDVTNEQLFSYPGYNEIFTGVADTNIRSNSKVDNKNVTFLEWINNQPEFAGKVAIFSGWDVFPKIYNRNRSGLIINAGFESFHPKETNSEIEWLNKLQNEIPSPWHNVRHDAFTYGFAKEYLKLAKPRILVINLGETDDFAHNGKYDSYLDSAQQTDAFLADLWDNLQSIEQYKNNTNMLIITDHGRGSNTDDWKHHASIIAIQNYMQSLNEFSNGIAGAEHIWFAAIGPDIQKVGILQNKTPFKQNQFAATALATLGFKVNQYSPKAGKPLQGIIKHEH